MDIDLRMRVRCKNSDSACADCHKIYSSIMNPSVLKDALIKSGDGDPYNDDNHHTCVLALKELARGFASLADGRLQHIINDVHLRIVSASSYEAIDPSFHTDKCPLRGYVTLAGPGTQYMERTCQPWEYAALRTLGVDNDDGYVEGMKSANELEFIVMKGDTYNECDIPLPDDCSPSLLGTIWKRATACVHRSPPAVEGRRGQRRVILSLDLADGVDDQEWYVFDKRRSWRSGMTQRKSRLVA